MPAAAAAAEHVGAGGGELPAGEGAVLPAPARPPSAQGKARRHHGLLRHPQDDLLQSEYPAPRVPARGLQCAGTRRGGSLPACCLHAACMPPARRAAPVRPPPAPQSQLSQRTASEGPALSWRPPARSRGHAALPQFLSGGCSNASLGRVLPPELPAAEKVLSSPCAK